MRIALLLFFLTIFSNSLIADWVKPSRITEEEWTSIKPYLLPYNDRLRKKLDVIFSNGRVVKNQTTLGMKHFYFPHWRGKNTIVVAKHIGIKNYIFKLFLDSQEIKNEWRHFIKRIDGSRLIKKAIVEKGLSALFKVPKKWLYLLPAAKCQNDGALFVLVAENAHLVSEKINRKQWKSKNLENKLLTGVYTLINELGLIDSVYIDNIPFCRDGKVAFIDTEHYNGSCINFKRFEHYLHPSKKNIWNPLWK